MLIKFLKQVLGQMGILFELIIWLILAFLNVLPLFDLSKKFTYYAKSRVKHKASCCLKVVRDVLIILVFLWTMHFHL